MRLGIDGRRLVGERTGVGRYLERLIHHWDQLPLPFDEVVCYVPRAAADAEGGSGVAAQVRLQVIPERGPGVFWENGPLRAAAKGCDVFFGAAYRLPLHCPVPAVVSNLGIYDGQPGTFPVWQQWRSRLVFGRSARQARVVIANSESTKRDIARFFRVAPEKVRVIYPGVDDVFGPMTDRAVTAARVRELTGHDGPYFLMVGKLSVRRHVPELLAAFARARATDCPERLVIVGTNHLGLPLEGLIRDAGVEGHVTHLSFVAQEALRHLYCGATAFVLATTHEGFSFTILEALACGAPVVTVDHAPLREGVYGSVLAVDAPTPERLAEALVRVATTPALRAELREKGLACARGFSWRRAAEETMNVLSDVAGRRT